MAVYRCIEDITDIHSNVIFTKGLIYEKVNSSPITLIDNKVEECEVSNFSEYFTCVQ